MVSRSTWIILAIGAAAVLGVGVLVYEHRRGRHKRSGKGGGKGGGKKKGKHGKILYRAPKLLNPQLHAESPWQMLESVLPPNESFAVMVDRAAALPEADGLSCHARDGYDISGEAALVWGLAFHVTSAAECCLACAAISSRLMFLFVECDSATICVTVSDKIVSNTFAAASVKSYFIKSVTRIS